MPDIFEDRSSGLESPAYHSAEVTPSDSTDLTTHARALFVGTGGDIRVMTSGGDTVVFRNVPAGILPVRIRRVFAVGTTAADMVAVW
ncbi:MAG: hypothetical protein AAF557_19755 [Pseudomonadota bacterium]